MRNIIKCVILLLFANVFLTGCVEKTTRVNYFSDNEVIADSEDISICFINSGKSDSILVKAFNKAYLIDTGTKDSVDKIQIALEKNNVSSLDGVFITHKHKDHLGGLKKLSKAYDIPVIYSSEISMNEEDGTNKIDTIIKERKLNNVKLKALDRVYINDDVYFEVIAPLEYNGEDDNDNSLVLRLNVYGKTAIFAGDMQFAEEQTLLNSIRDLKADILKVGNHGNKDATSEAFVMAVEPEIAVITTDRNEDPGTASKRVKTIFKNTNLYITDDYDIGFLVIINPDGKIICSNQSN